MGSAPDFTEAGSAAADGGAKEAYVLLDDQPVIASSRDCLDSVDTASRLARILRASISSGQSAPFALAIDAPWGTGKSTLLRQLCVQLEPGRQHSRRDRDSRPIRCVQFNAWTADNSAVLDTLIATLVSELDANFARRWARKLARQRGLLSALRASVSLAAGFFGLARAVDAFMASLSISTRTRGEIRDSLNLVLSDWLTGSARGGGNRALVVFVDDLDRCSSRTVVQMCEAIKLYLDVPGIIFVLACDLLMLGQGLAADPSARGGQAFAYLEKIIQVAYHMPRPSDSQIDSLIGQCARDSGITELIDETVTRALAERTNRNPRRIKRVINSFVLEYMLEPDWAESQLGAANLIKVVLLYQLYPWFYDVLVGDYSSIDPIGDFLEYAKLVNRPDQWQELAVKVLASYHSQTQVRTVDEAIQEVASRLPKSMAKLARDKDFISLLESLGEAPVRKAVRARLRRVPLRSERLIDGLSAALQLNKLTDQLEAQVMASEGAADAEQAQYRELQLEADANNAAASSVAQAATHKMQLNSKIMEGFEQVLSGDDP